MCGPRRNGDDYQTGLPLELSNLTIGSQKNWDRKRKRSIFYARTSTGPNYHSANVAFPAQTSIKANGKLDAAKHLDLLKIKCFSRDTLVHTATGPRPIGEIEPGEQIWSYHFERGVWGLCEVKERLDNTYSGPVVSITVDNTTIEATAYHPFWVIEGRDLQERSKPRELQEHEDEGLSLPGRWVNSHELRAGDCIITRSGTRAIISEMLRAELPSHFWPNCNCGDFGLIWADWPSC